MSCLLYRHYFPAVEERDQAFAMVSRSAEEGDLGDVRIDLLSVGHLSGASLHRGESEVNVIKHDAQEDTSPPCPFLEFTVPELTPADVALAFDCLVVTNMDPVGEVWLSGYGLEDLALYSSARHQALPSGQAGVLLSSEDFSDFVG
jgi:hypothetical protein